MSDNKAPARIALALTLAFSASACSGEKAPEVGAATSAPAVASAASSAPGAPNVPVMAEFGGGMHALAEACGGYTGAELDKMKREQREQAIQSGMSPAAFDADFAKGYEGTSTKFRSGTPAEREKACAQMQELKQFGEGLEQREAMRQR